MPKVSLRLRVQLIVLAILTTTVLFQNCAGGDKFREDGSTNELSKLVDSKLSASNQGANSINLLPADFPDPFIIQVPETDEPNKLGGKFRFYSTHNKMMAFDTISGLSADNPPVIENIIINIDFLANNGLDKNYFAASPNLWSKNVYYHPETCDWHMIASVRIIEKNYSEPDHNKIWPMPFKTSIVHLAAQRSSALPTDKCSESSLDSWSKIRSWRIDKMLVGTADANFEYANYAGKIVRDSVTKKLYMVYVKRFSDNRNGIAAHPMLSPSEMDTNATAVALIEPERDLKSELRYPEYENALQIIETGNLIQINDWWVLLYTAGDYQNDNYKIGVAYSKDILGPFTKVKQPDFNSQVWGGATSEVVYLLQSQKSNWPNYTQFVKAPGVPTILKENGRYFLFFAGYPESVQKDAVKELYDPALRKAYYVPLLVNIPPDSNKPSADWIKLDSAL